MIGAVVVDDPILEVESVSCCMSFSVWFAEKVVVMVEAVVRRAAGLVTVLATNGARFEIEFVIAVVAFGVVTA